MFTRNIISPTLCRSQESISNNWQVANKEENKDIYINSNTSDNINRNRPHPITTCCSEYAQSYKKCCVTQQVPKNAHPDKDDISMISQLHSTHNNLLTCLNGGKSADGETMDIGLLKTPSRQATSPGEKQSCADTHKVKCSGNFTIM